MAIKITDDEIQAGIQLIDEKMRNKIHEIENSRDYEIEKIKSRTQEEILHIEQEAEVERNVLVGQASHEIEEAANNEIQFLQGMSDQHQ